MQRRAGNGMGICRLDGRRIIVTGGASGMGEAMVRAFPGLGANVVSLDVSEEVGAGIAKEAGAGFATADARDFESVDAPVTPAAGGLRRPGVPIHAPGLSPSSPAPATPAPPFHPPANL